MGSSFCIFAYISTPSMKGGDFMNEQEHIGKCCITIANVMKEYAKLGTDDCFEVNTHLKEAMKTMSHHLTENNQILFANWLLKQIEDPK